MFRVKQQRNQPKQWRPQQTVLRATVSLALLLAAYSLFQVHSLLRFSTGHEHSASFRIRPLQQASALRSSLELASEARTANGPLRSAAAAAAAESQAVVHESTPLHHAEAAAAVLGPAGPQAGGAQAGSKCYVMRMSELWGDVVTPGSSHHTDTLGECCDACLKHAQQATDGKPCKVWSWCGVEGLCGSRHRQCWLGHQAESSQQHPVLVDDLHMGWTSGYVSSVAAPPQQDATRNGRQPVRKYHVLSSASKYFVGRWQIRIHYYWYLKRKAECERELGDACELGEYTRIIPTGEPDDLVDEIPTFVAKPMDPSLVGYTRYDLYNRAYGLLQWAHTNNATEDFVIIEESDHIFLNVSTNLMVGNQVTGHHYDYMIPTEAKNIPVIAEFMPSKNFTEDQAKLIAPSGSSPTYLSKEQLLKVTPAWLDVMIKMVKSPASNKEWHWIQEMWAFVIGAHLVGEDMVALPHLLAHPPVDNTTVHPSGKPWAMLHYTWVMEYFDNGTQAPAEQGDWWWNKRDYMLMPPPRDFPDPPSTIENPLVHLLIELINEATHIPCWDNYSWAGAIRRRRATCDEVIPGSIYPRPPQRSGVA